MSDAAATAPAAIETLDFKTDAGLGHRARIGLIVLQTDQTIERAYAQFVPGDGVALCHARSPNAMEVSPETLRQMQRDLPAAAALLPASFGFDAVGYACPSGATMIGEVQVDKMIRAVHPQARAATPPPPLPAAAWHCCKRSRPRPDRTPASGSRARSPSH